MKILFISYKYRQELATVERVTSLIRVLSKRHTLVGLPPVSFKSPISLLDRPFRLAERIYEPWKMLNSAAKIGNVDLIFASQSRQALAARLIAKRINRPLIFDSHGNPELLCNSVGAGPLVKLRNSFPEKLLKKVVRRLITVSEIDKAAYVKMGFEKDIIDVIPCCIDFSKIETVSQKEAREILGLPKEKIIILFFAMYDYFPNAEAMKYINRKLAPIFPNATFVLAGKGGIRENLCTNVQFVGFIERIGVLIRAANICIAPIWHGVGILEKVLMMLAYGMPTVVSSFAKRGIPELEDGVNCLIASNETEFAEKTKALIKDVSVQNSIGDNAAELIRQKYNWALYEERLFNIVESIR